MLPKINNVVINSACLTNGTSYEVISSRPIFAIEVVPKDASKALVGHLTFTKGANSVVMDLGAGAYYQGVGGVGQLVMAVAGLDPAYPFVIYLRGEQ